MKQLLSKKVKKSILFFAVFMLNSSWVLANFENVDCKKDQKSLGISFKECKVLEKLWESTLGKNWQVNQGWDTVTKVDTWEGVSVKEGRVSSLLLYSDNIRGELPVEIGELTALKRLSFANNKLSGNIPESLGNLKKLEYLDLSDNQFNGEVPFSLGRLLSLTELYLNNNELSGNIPDSLGDLKHLRVLKMYENNLFGAIPLTLGSLSNLEVLSLAENRLSKNIPSELGNLSKLTFLDLKFNQLTGKIPEQLGNLESLTGLYLQHNRLEESIPFEFGNLLHLTDLDLSDNKLNGNIPSSLGELSVLTYLNVSSNRLEGDVPVELLKLSRLNYLNLEKNKFIPSNLDAIRSELTFIPEVRIAFQENTDKSVMDKVVSEDIEHQDLHEITIEVLSEKEVAMLELDTLQIVGTKEAGESLVVENEGEWSIDDNKIIFTPFDNFTDIPTPISYIIEDENGIKLNPVEVSIKQNSTRGLEIDVLGERSSKLYLLDILVSDDFMNNHPNYLLSKDKKELQVDDEGRWRVEENGTISFIAAEGFNGNPSSVGYRLLKKDGDKIAVGLIEIKNKISVEENSEYANSVSLFGVKGLFLMLLFGGLYGVFYIREIENKKI